MPRKNKKPSRVEPHLAFGVEQLREGVAGLLGSYVMPTDAALVKLCERLNRLQVQNLSPRRKEIGIAFTDIDPLVARYFRFAMRTTNPSFQPTLSPLSPTCKFIASISLQLNGAATTAASVSTRLIVLHGAKL